MSDSPYIFATHNYLDITTIVYSSSIFTFFKYLNIEKESKLITNISNTSFGIYLIHFFFIELLNYLFNFIKFSPFTLLISALLIYSLCFISIYLLEKVPILNKLVRKKYVNNA